MCQQLEQMVQMVFYEPLGNILEYLKHTDVWKK